MGLFSSIGKALFGGKKKTTSSKATETSSGTTTVAPYAPVIPYLNSYLDNTQRLYSETPMFSQQEMQGYNMLQQAAGASNVALDPAIAENNKTLSGAYLDPDSNPYLKDIANRMGGQAMAGANATFGGRGRTGGGLHQLYVSQGIGDAVGSVYGAAYDAERNRMGNAVGMAPNLAAGKLAPAAAIYEAGRNMSARPFDINAQYGGILGQIAGLGQQGSFNTTGTSSQQNYKQSSGLLGKIAGGVVNKLFGI